MVAIGIVAPHLPGWLAAPMRDMRPEAAEALGTFAMMLVGGGAIAAGLASPLVALAFGGAVMVLVYALGHVCGAHFNPAVTLAFATTGHFPWRRVPTYMLAQVLGACLAVAALAPLAEAHGLVTHGLQAGLAATAIEAAATALLAFVILAVATDRRAAPGVAGLAIGTTVTLGALVAGPLTGAAMNPARALAPALLAAEWSDLAPHLLGPLIGGALGMLAYEGVRRGDRPKAEGSLGASGPIDLEDAP